MTAAQISARILAHVSQGMTLDRAIDSVLGSGSYSEVVGSVYQALRAATAEAR